MASYINTNLASQQAQRSLSTAQTAMNSSIQRLSSGLRVNGAKDDAAGLAIATGMDKTMRGQTVAMRNANDAISFSQTTEGALGKVGDTLQRMRELAVQSSNGTNSADQRTAMDTEFKELQAEITRVTTNTEFNGKKVLGADAKQTFQIGSGTSSDNQIAINGTDLTLATSKVAKSVSIGTGTALDATQKGAIDTYAALAAPNQTQTDALKTALGTGATDQSASFESIVTAVKDFKAAGGGAGGGVIDVTGGTTTQGNASAADLAKFNAAMDTTNGVNISTATNATAAINKIDDALKEVNTAQTIQGAAQNRMASVISTLQVSNENQSAARSRIMDTDFASETANMARSQILQQASTAMLAQANQLPNGVMKLLG